MSEPRRGAPATPGFAASRPESCAYTTRKPVVHLPAMLNGLHIGFVGRDGRPVVPPPA